MDSHSNSTYSSSSSTSFSSSFNDDAVFEELLHYFLTSTQNADTPSLSSYFTNGDHHPSSLCSSGPHRHFCQNWSSLSSLLVVISQLLFNVPQLVFLQSTSSQNWSFFSAAAFDIVTELVFFLCRRHSDFLI